MAGKKSKDGDWYYPRHPDKLGFIGDYYENMPAFREEIRGEIALDRARSAKFMVHFGNLMELPSKDGPDFYFQNDFATYAAVARKNSETFDIYGYFTDGHAISKERDAAYFKWLKEKIESGKFKGIHLGQAQGPVNAEKFIHRNFCEKFALLLDSQSPLTLEDIRHNFRACAGMIGRHRLRSSLQVEDKVDATFEMGHLAASIIEPVSGFLTAAKGTYRLWRRLKNSDGRYWTAFLPHTHPCHARKPFPIAEASQWRILTDREAQVRPLDGSKPHDTIQDAWALEELATVIRSSTPCIVKSIGNGVISAQQPNGSKLYASSGGQSFIVYLPDRRLDPAPGTDPDMYKISDRFEEYYKPGMVTCLRLRNGFSAAEEPHQIDAQYIPYEEAYRMIGKLAERDGKALMEADRPAPCPAECFRPTRSGVLAPQYLAA